MNQLAIRFTIFSLLIIVLSLGFAAAVLHENRGVGSYQSGIVFR